MITNTERPPIIKSPRKAEEVRNGIDAAESYKEIIHCLIRSEVNNRIMAYAVTVLAVRTNLLETEEGKNPLIIVLGHCLAEQGQYERFKDIEKLSTRLISVAPKKPISDQYEIASTAHKGDMGINNKRQKKEDTSEQEQALS